MQLGPVRLQVASLQRSITFYENVLGFRVLGRSGGEATLGAQGSAAPLVRLAERPGARAVPRSGCLGLFHVAFLLPARAALGQFVKHLARAGIPAGMSDHLVSEAIYLNDPDGLGIEVYADRPRAAWRYDGAQIEMATIPLDVQSLVKAAGEATWNGAPAGTAVGHVHLHVGDLGAAEAFYHAALGLDKTVWNYPAALFLAAGGYHHHLGLNTWAAGAPPATDEDARLIEWTLAVPGGDAATQSLEKAGFSVRRDADGWRAADPWGTTLHLVELQANA